jgi:hypothetical protein
VVKEFQALKAELPDLREKLGMIRQAIGQAAEEDVREEMNRVREAKLKEKEQQRTLLISEVEADVDLADEFDAVEDSEDSEDSEVTHVEDEAQKDEVDA